MTDPVRVDGQVFVTYTLQDDGSVVLEADLGFDSDFVVEPDLFAMPDDAVDHWADSMKAIAAACRSVPFRITIPSKET